MTFHGRFRPSYSRYLVLQDRLKKRLYGGKVLTQVVVGQQIANFGERSPAQYVACVLAVYLDHPEEVEAICALGKTASVNDACIDGLVSYHLVQYNSLSVTQAFCALFDEANQETCLASLREREAYYP